MHVPSQSGIARLVPMPVVWQASSVCVCAYIVLEIVPHPFPSIIYASCLSGGVFTANPSCHLFNYYADAAISSLIDFKHCLLMAVGSGD